MNRNSTVTGALSNLMAIGREEKRRVPVLVALTCVLAFAQAGWATITGTVSGIVTDPSGAVIPARHRGGGEPPSRSRGPIGRKRCRRTWAIRSLPMSRFTCPDVPVPPNAFSPMRPYLNPPSRFRRSTFCNTFRCPIRVRFSPPPPTTRPYETTREVFDSTRTRVGECFPPTTCWTITR